MAERVAKCRFRKLAKNRPETATSQFIVITCTLYYRWYSFWAVFKLLKSRWYSIGFSDATSAVDQHFDLDQGCTTRGPRGFFLRPAFPMIHWVLENVFVKWTITKNWVEDFSRDSPLSVLWGLRQSFKTFLIAPLLEVRRVQQSPVERRVTENPSADGYAKREKHRDFASSDCDIALSQKPSFGKKRTPFALESWDTQRPWWKSWECNSVLSKKFAVGQVRASSVTWDMRIVRLVNVSGYSYPMDAMCTKLCSFVYTWATRQAENVSRSCKVKHGQKKENRWREQKIHTGVDGKWLLRGG